MDKSLEYCTKFRKLSDIVFLSSTRYFFNLNVAQIILQLLSLESMER